MAAEAIPLIQSLLAAMGLTAAGSAKGKKYNIPGGYSKKEQKKDIEEHIKRMEAEEAIKDDNYDDLPEDMKKDLADLVNKEFAGFGGEPDNKDNKPKNDKDPPPPAAKPKEMKLDRDLENYDDKLKAAKEARKRWGEEIEVDESQFMGGSKAAHKAEKMKNMSSPEAVQRSREQFMEGKPNSLDTDKAVSELHGQQKAKLRNKTVTQDASDILEHHVAPEDTRMTNKALSDDKLKKLLGLSAGTIIGGIHVGNVIQGATIKGGVARNGTTYGGTTTGGTLMPAAANETPIAKSVLMNPDYDKAMSDKLDEDWARGKYKNYTDLLLMTDRQTHTKTYTNIGTAVLERVPNQNGNVP